jgi:hypothetical protein
METESDGKTIKDQEKMGRFPVEFVAANYGDIVTETE